MYAALSAVQRQPRHRTVPRRLSASTLIFSERCVQGGSPAFVVSLVIRNCLIRKSERRRATYGCATSPKCPLRRARRTITSRTSALSSAFWRFSKEKPRSQMCGPSTQIALALWAIARLSATHQHFIYEQKCASHGCHVCGGRGGRRSRILSRGDVSGAVFDVTRSECQIFTGTK